MKSRLIPVILFLVSLLLTGCEASLDNPRGLPLRLKTVKKFNNLVSTVIPFKDPLTNEAYLVSAVFSDDSAERYLEIYDLESFVVVNRFNLLNADNNENIPQLKHVLHPELYYQDDSTTMFAYINEIKKDTIKTISINLNDGSRKRIYQRVRPASKMTDLEWDAGVSQPITLQTIHPLDPEGYMSLSTGFHPDNRRVLILDSINPLEIRCEIINGAAVNNLLQHDIDGDGRSELLLATNAPQNGHKEGLMDDSRCWYAAYTSEGENIWNISLKKGGGSSALRFFGHKLLGIQSLNSLTAEGNLIILREINPSNGEIQVEKSFQGNAYWSYLNPEEKTRAIISVDPLEEAVRFISSEFHVETMQRKVVGVEGFNSRVYLEENSSEFHLVFYLKNGSSILTDSELSIVAYIDGSLLNAKEWENATINSAIDEQLYLCRAANNSLEIVKFERAPFLEWFTARNKWPLVILVVLGAGAPAVHYARRSIIHRKNLRLQEFQSMKDMQKANLQLHQLHEKIQKIREDELAEISNTLHGELGQIIPSLMWDLDDLEFDDKESADSKARIMQKIEQLENIVRDLNHAIHPPRLDYGLKKAIENLFVNCSDKKLNIEFEYALSSELDRDRSRTVYRICQEALNNCIKYARASLFKIKITSYENILYLRIKDDGIGFNEAEIDPFRSTGLFGMRERLYPYDGTLEIISTPGQGTELNIQLSLDGISDNDDIKRRGIFHD